MKAGGSALLVLACGLAASQPARAEVATHKDGRWRGLVGASVAFTSGNTVTNSALLNLDVARQTSHTKVSLQGYLNHATNKVQGTNRTTADKWGPGQRG